MLGSVDSFSPSSFVVKLDFALVFQIVGWPGWLNELSSWIT
jgi:hypothetical protein